MKLKQIRLGVQSQPAAEAADTFLGLSEQQRGGSWQRVGAVPAGPLWVEARALQVRLCSSDSGASRPASPAQPPPLSSNRRPGPLHCSPTIRGSRGQALCPSPCLLSTTGVSATAEKSPLLQGRPHPTVSGRCFAFWSRNLEQ